MGRDKILNFVAAHFLYKIDEVSNQKRPNQGSALDSGVLR